MTGQSVLMSLGQSSEKGASLREGPFSFGIIHGMKFRMLALALVGVLVVMGCSTVSISPSPTPEPTSTPITAQAWAALPPLPTPRTAASVAVANGRIYVMGGLDELGRSSTKVEVFDPRNRGWTEAASLPTPLYHSAAVMFNSEGVDKILLFGGLSGRRSKASNAAYIYEPRLDRWDELTAMPSSRGALTATVYGDLVYVIGGVEEDAVSSRIDIYEPSSDSWRRGPSLPSGRSHMSAATVGRLIYVIGGKSETGGASLGLVETLDPTTGAWAEVQELGMARANLGALEHGGRLYILGGEDIDRALESAMSFDPKSARWLTFQPLPSSLHGAATAKVDGIAYSIGGSVGPGFSVVGDAYAIALQ